MRESDTFSFIRRQLEEKLDLQIEHMTQGGCADYAEYKNSSGKIQMIKFAISVVDDVEQKFLAE